MKYAKQLYIDSQIFSGDMDGSESNFSEKIVKTRKPHQCCICGEETPKPCIEEWLEESGQV